MINGPNLLIICPSPINLITGITEITLLIMGRIKGQFIDRLSCLPPPCRKIDALPEPGLATTGLHQL